MLTAVRSLVIALSLFAITPCLANHKIIYFISPPRSLSVSFLRMMQARGDFQILHEPSQFAFNMAHSRDFVKKWFKPDAPATFEEVKQLIFAAAKQGNVFVKEMSFATHDFLINDPEFLNHPDVRFVILMRNPHHTAISMYKKFKHIFPEVAHQVSMLFGYKSLYGIVQAFQKHHAPMPYIMLTEDLYENPEATIKTFCQAIGIPFVPEALSWESLGSEFDGQAWHEIKHVEMTHHWHNDAIHSTGFGKPATYAVGADGNPTFEEIENLEHRQACIKAYEENLPYYQMLHALVKKS